MTGIVLPGKGDEGLRLLRDWVPECLIPLAGKPFLDHQIEMFVRSGITRIVVVVCDRLYEVEEYFGRGERWGVSLLFILASPGQSSATHLALALPHLDDGPSVVVSAATTPAFPLARMLGEFAVAALPLLVTGSGYAAGLPLIAGPGVLTELAGRGSPSLLDAAGQMGGASFESGLSSWEVGDLPGYLAENRALLNGERPGVIIPAREREPGVWVGRNSRIASSVRLKPPVYVGANCQIRENCVIDGAVICDRVVVDRAALVTGSVVMENSFIGSNTEVTRAVVRKNGIINVEQGVAVTVTDPIILADLTEALPGDSRHRFFDLTVAVALLILCSPLLLPLLLLDTLLPSLQLMVRERRYGNRELPTLSGAYVRKPFTLHRLRFGPLVIRKLPGLMAVLRGNLALVGAQPPSDEELAEITGKFQELRQDNTRGLFHIWEAEGESDTSFEEKLVMENFYAATRSWKEDLKILLRVGRGAC